MYAKYLTRELAKLGHRVEVFSGPPYPDLSGEPVELTRISSLDLYRADDPFRMPKLKEFRSVFDAGEFAVMATGGFPEPRSFGWRFERVMDTRVGEFDLIHDNQSLSWSLLRLKAKGWPVVSSVHHPITVDRELALSHARGLKAKLGAFRWYGFVRMQKSVASQLPRIITVSETSKRDLAGAMGVGAERSRVVPIGVDTDVFRPIGRVARVPGLIVTTASADVPLKGLKVLVDAMADVANVCPQAHLAIIGKPNPDSDLPRQVERLGLGGKVRFLGVVGQQEMVRLYNRAELAVVPSLYEGFSLPAIEAMACGTALVATTGGALPEVTGRDRETVLRAKAGDSIDLAKTIIEGLESPMLRNEVALNGRRRVLDNFTWAATARATERVYAELLREMGRL